MEQDGVRNANRAAKFLGGRFLVTPNALQEIHHDEIVFALSRHMRGDWGKLDREDWSANERALEYGGRLFSQYHSIRDVKFWVITEADRSATTVLLPEDY